MSFYKADQGSFRTKSLFFEYSAPAMRQKYPPPFTIKEDDYEKDGEIYVSMKRLYLEKRDPTEYLFAKEVLGSYPAWTVLKDSTFFKPFGEAWHTELMLLLQAENIQEIRLEAASDSKGASSAAKWLAEKGWDKTSTKGRPSNNKIKAEAARLRNEVEEEEEFLSHVDNVSPIR